MRTYVVLSAIVFAVNLSGCAKTTVILLPDEGGKAGAVTVNTQAGSQVLDQAYHYVTASRNTSPPSEVRTMDEAKVNQAFDEILKAQPVKPLSFLLYFNIGSTELTEQSRASLPQIIEAIKGRGHTMISIIGHTDTTGTEEINARVSLERAAVVKQLLTEQIPTLDNIELQFFGEKELLISTPPNTPEPRNRRVEIMII